MTDYDSQLRLIRIARGLENGGAYNAAKLFWAVAFSNEVGDAGDHPYRGDQVALVEDMEAAISDLEQQGYDATLIAAMRAGQDGAVNNRTISWDEVPDVYVCRDCGEIVITKERPYREPCPRSDTHALRMRFMKPIYFMDFLSPDEVLNALAVMPEKVAGLAGGLTQEQMDQRPSPREWGVGQVLWHMLKAQSLLDGRVNKMLNEDNPDLAGAATWTDSGDGRMTGEEILAAYIEARQATLNTLRGISAEDWWRPGIHEEWGSVTVLSQSTYFARHEASHWQQMYLARQALDG